MPPNSTQSRSSYASRGKNVSLQVNGRPIGSRRVESPLDLIALIEMTAQRNGIHRYEVFVNGIPVSPNEIGKVFEQSNSLVVDLRQDDYAAGGIRDVL